MHLYQYRTKTAAVLTSSGKYQHLGRLVDIFLINIIIINVIAIILESDKQLAQLYHTVFWWIEVISVLAFCIEYLLRVWASVDTAQYQQMSGSHFKKRCRYMASPLAIIDLLAILPSLLIGLFNVDLRFLRVIRLVRIFKLTRYSKAMQMLLTAFKEEASSLLAAFFIMLVVLIMASCGIYLIEQSVQPEKFGSIPKAMWWAMATLTTVGYGDIVPITPLGKVFGGVITLMSMGMVAIPTGLLASSFANQLRKKRDAFNEALVQAMSDGTLDEEDKTHLDALRIEFGMSQLEANQAIKILTTEQEKKHYCPHCGKHLE